MMILYNMLALALQYYIYRPIDVYIGPIVSQV